MERKYELTKNTIKLKGKKLYRIKALKDFGDVKKGDLGGLIESEKNLSHEGNCWIYDDAKVYGNAIVCDNATVHGNARVFKKSKLCHDASVWDNALVYGYSMIGGNAIVRDNSRIYGGAIVYDNARICDNARIYDSASICGNAMIYDNSIVSGHAIVCGEVVLYGNARVYGHAHLRYGRLKDDIKENLIQYIACSLNVYPNPATNTYILYKKVNKISDGVYESLYDDSFIYRDGEVVEVKDYDPDFLASCSSGLHVSTPFYWKDGNTLIAVKVHVNDIITCMEGKIRCRKLKVLGEVKF